MPPQFDAAYLHDSCHDTFHIATNPSRKDGRNSLGLALSQEFMSMDDPTSQRQSAERLLFLEKQKKEGLKAADEYKAREEARRLLTAKLRAERLAREAVAAKPEAKEAKRKRG